LFGWGFGGGNGRGFCGGWSVVGSFDCALRAPLRMTRGLALCAWLRMTRGSGGAGCGFALGAVFGFQVGGGDLAGVEEMAGSFAVQLVVGDAAGDLAEGLLNGVEVVQAGQEEAVRWVAEDGRGTDAVLMAVVLAAHGVGWAASVVVDVLEARVRTVGILDVFCDFGHGYPPRGCGKLDS
jgi:hypothetical protein